MNAENLIEAETGQELAAALSAVDDMKMPVAELAQTQGHSRHRSHERGIHHGAMFEVDDEFAIATVDHLPGEFLQVAAVEKASFALNSHPNGFAVYSDLY